MDIIIVLLLLGIFIFRDQLSDIIFVLSKSILYTLIFFFGISFINGPFATRLKKLLTDIINYESPNLINKTFRSTKDTITNIQNTYYSDSNKQLLRNTNTPNKNILGT